MIYDNCDLIWQIADCFLFGKCDSTLYYMKGNKYCPSSAVWLGLVYPSTCSSVKCVQEEYWGLQVKNITSCVCGKYKVLQSISNYLRGGNYQFMLILINLNIKAIINYILSTAVGNAYLVRGSIYFTACPYQMEWKNRHRGLERWTINL